MIGLTFFFCDERTIPFFAQSSANVIAILLSFPLVKNNIKGPLMKTLCITFYP
ncbi:hypothetical protein [EBPR podovirus 3]|nr:hypothetical protein [EBPR podovirus 3]